jgi:hypothetical protein
MNGFSMRVKHNIPTSFMESLAPINIFTIEEEIFIKQAHFIEGYTTN